MNKINLNKESLLGICLFDSNYLLIGTKNKRVILIDLKEGKIKKYFPGHNHWVCSIKKFKHIKFGDCLITQGLDNKIKLWKNNNLWK